MVAVTHTRRPPDGITASDPPVPAPATSRERGRSSRHRGFAAAFVAIGLLATACAADPASSARPQPEAGVASPSAETAATGEGGGARSERGGPSDGAGTGGASGGQDGEPGSGGITAGESGQASGAGATGGGNTSDGAATGGDGATASGGDAGAAGDGATGGGNTSDGAATGGDGATASGGDAGDGATGGTAGSGTGSATGDGTGAGDGSGSVDPAPAPPITPPGPRFPEPLGLTLTRLVELPVPLALAVRAQEPESLYVALRHGVVVRLRGDGGRADSSVALRRDGDPVLDMSARVATEGEMGLLGLTFSPAGDRLYTSSVNRQQVSELWEWPVAPDGSVDAGRGRLVLSLPQPFWNHNGGDVTFGPDGYLYLGFGDGGGAGDPLRAGQDSHDWLGTILRIDPRPGPSGEPYTIPAGNPFADGAAGAPEVWVWGARNPWRFSFDRVTGDLWVADVGQDLLEEINRLPAGQAGTGAGRGANLGWSDYEGSAPFWSNDEPPGHVGPVVEYRHGADDRCSVTGGYVYRGRRLPGLTGVYLYGDFCDGTIWGYSDTAGAHPLMLARGAPPFGSVLSFGEGPDGEIYVLSSDALWRLEHS